MMFVFWHAPLDNAAALSNTTMAANNLGLGLSRVPADSAQWCDLNNDDGGLELHNKVGKIATDQPISEPSGRGAHLAKVQNLLY